MRKHVWKVLGILALPGFAVLGFASSLLLTSDTLAGDTTDMPRCSTAAIQLIPNYTTTKISSFTVSNIPVGAGQCNGRTLAVGWQWGATTNTTGSGIIASNALTVTMATSSTITVNPTVQLVMH